MCCKADRRIATEALHGEDGVRAVKPNHDLLPRECGRVAPIERKGNQLPSRHRSTSPLHAFGSGIRHATSNWSKLERAVLLLGAKSLSLMIFSLRGTAKAQQGPRKKQRADHVDLASCTTLIRVPSVWTYDACWP